MPGRDVLNRPPVSGVAWLAVEHAACEDSTVGTHLTSIDGPAGRHIGF
jgi:hypothetical protein